MSLYLGTETYGQRRWQDFWWPEETILDYLARPMVETCQTCHGVNGEHYPCCEVSVTEAAKRGWTPQDAMAWAEDHDKAGFPELAKHWRKVAERIPC